MPNRHTNGAQLAVLRVQRGIRQTDLAAKADVSAFWLREIEKGRVQPSAVIVYRLATALNVSPDEFSTPGSDAVPA